MHHERPLAVRGRTPEKGRVTTLTESEAMGSSSDKASIIVDAALLQQILDALPIGVWIADPQGMLVANNPAGRDIWQGERWIGPEQYSEYKAWWTDTGKRVEAREWAMTKVITREEAVVRGQMLDIEAFDGTRKTILNHAVPIHDEAGRLRAAIAVNQDISDLKQANDALDLLRRQLQAVSGAVLEAQEEERRRIARELHDGLGQVLSALKITVETVRRRCRDETCSDLLQRAVAMTDTLLGDVRAITRRLRPPPLEDMGLVAAVRWHLDQLAIDTSIAIRLAADTLIARLPANVEIACFRIIQEAVSNAIRHSGAKQIEVTLADSDSCLSLSVVDDGCGFHPQPLAAPAGQQPLGLLGMRERAALLGGEMRIVSAPGAGTEIHVQIPLRPAEKTP